MDHNQITLGEAIEEMLQELHLDRGYVEREALSEWKRIMPEALRKRITSVRIQRGTLLIRTDSAVLRNELQMKKTKIKEHLNRAAGRSVIQTVQVF
ncbi:MAG: DUF721 domain-containing protein [Flavobacteriales bacterium]